MDKENARILAKKIWDYHLMHNQLEKADCILSFGTRDIRVAERAAELFFEGWAPLLVFTGGHGHRTKDWELSEAETHRDIAIKMGVPKDKILVETKSTNTGDNVLFTKTLLAKNNVDPRKLILVHKPYMERRTYATFKKLWPEKEIIVTSPAISLEDFPYGDITEDEMINIMVGDLQRIIEYPAQGFQIAQDIPEDVSIAYDKLIEAGYTKRLIK